MLTVEQRVASSTSWLWHASLANGARTAPRKAFAPAASSSFDNSLTNDQTVFRNNNMLLLTLCDNYFMLFSVPRVWRILKVRGYETICVRVSRHMDQGSGSQTACLAWREAGGKDVACSRLGSTPRAEVG
jgi:hypothetical protein